MGARSLRKGHAWEREVAAMFTAAGIAAERNLSESRTANAGGPGDLLLPSDVPLAVQCRVGAEPSPWRALRDAQEAAQATGPGVVPVGLLRRNRRGSRGPEGVAVLPLRDLVARVAAVRGKSME